MAQPGPEPESNTPEAPRRLPTGLILRLFLPFAAGYYLSYLFRSVNAVTAPNLVADTGITADELGFLTATYMGAFALMQLPLGIALDRYGPRRVEATLLTLAAAGSLAFALAGDLAGLSLGRALIGVGVSCCMMASFKAFATWFAPNRLPLANACLMACGALGAVSATVPVEWFLGLTSWRWLFVGLAVFSLLLSITVYFVVPDHEEPPGHLHFREQLRGLGQVFRDRFFWGITPLGAISGGGSMGIIGLWAGPWLRDVAGLDRPAVANGLLICSIALGVGFLSWGLVTDRLTRMGLRPMTVAGGGMASFLVLLVIMATGQVTDTGLWILLAAIGFLPAAASLNYAIVSQRFPRDLAGRANTAHNVLVFVTAFVVQWGIGGILRPWEDPATHEYGAVGYQVAFSVVAVLQAVALVWFLRTWLRDRRASAQSRPATTSPAAGEGAATVPPTRPGNDPTSR